MILFIFSILSDLIYYNAALLRYNQRSNLHGSYEFIVTHMQFHIYGIYFSEVLTKISALFLWFSLLYSIEIEEASTGRDSEMKIDVLHITDAEFVIIKLLWETGKPLTTAEIGLLRPDLGFLFARFGSDRVVALYHASA